ncbi:MAG: TraL conjugative transposon family protein [Bacteroidales bacterium]|nr:TraL conjugative transposon family protein [Bacteroidales bacterium]
MATGIKHALAHAGDAVEHRLRLLCGKPTPMKRFILVLVIGMALAIANVWFVISSIYNIGRGETELMKVQHIEALRLQKDSVNQGL